MWTREGGKASVKPVCGGKERLFFFYFNTICFYVDSHSGSTGVAVFFFISPATFNDAPAIVDFFVVFVDDVPLFVTFGFLALLSFSFRETKAEVLTAAVYCEASVTRG